MKTIEQLVLRCRAAGMRMTPQRRAIFAHLAGNEAHPTAEEIHRAVQRKHRGLSLATVYNTLEILHRLGEVTRHDLGGQAERFDPEVRPHHHFICKGCGDIQDVFADLPLVGLTGPEGCQIDRIEALLAGLCKDCRATPERPTNGSTRRRGSLKHPMKGAAHVEAAERAQDVREPEGRVRR